jgi:methyl-accepting chemotaxis protein
MKLDRFLPKDLSLLAKTLIPLLAVVAVSIGGNAMWSLRAFEQQLEAEFQKRVIFAESMSRAPLTLALRKSVRDGADEILSDLSTFDGLVYGVVLDAKGEEFARIGADDRDEGQRDRTVLSLVGSDGSLLGEFIFGISRADIAPAISVARRNAVVFAGIIFVLTALAIAWITHKISRPIRNLAGVISDLGCDKTDVQYQYPSDTIGSLERGLDQFRETLMERNMLKKSNASLQAEILKRDAEIAQGRACNVAIEQDAVRAMFAQQQNEKLERNAAMEIAKVVSACARGDFSRRVSPDGKMGIFLEMGEGLNAVGEVAQEGLNEISAAIHALAEGNFEFRIDNLQHGIFAEISQAINHTAGILGKTIGTVIVAGQTVALSSTEIATSTADIATRTTDTAQTLKIVAASLTELTNLVDATAASTDRTNELVVRAVQDVATSETTLSKTRKSIGAIKSSSAEISKIVEVIEGIASQTNFLALNAGVEAARAGDKGKGFGVIASEVRALSQRSAQAAQNIAEIIRQSEEEIEVGVQSVKDCVGALGVVTISTDTIAQEIEDVALASRSQSTRIGAIRTALLDLETAMEKTSAVCITTSASTRQLDCQANDLSDLATSLAEPRGMSLTKEQEHRNVA